MREFIFTIFIFFGTSFNIQAYNCEIAFDIFRGKFNQIDDYLRSKLRSPKNGSLLRDDELVVEMVKRNPQLIFQQSEIAQLKKNYQLDSFRVIKIDELNKVYSHPNYSTYDGTITYRVKGEIRKREIYFRTNNEVLIPYPQQALQKGMIDRIVFRDQNGKIKTQDLSEVIIDSLDNSPKFSRGMSQVEYDLWRTNKLEEITSRRNTNGTVLNPTPWRSVQASSKTHFALEGFNFYNKPHINFSIPKQVLKELYRKGLLKITPYTSDLNIPIHGMPKEARTSFGLEVEFIIYTQEGRKMIAPYIQAGIK